MQGRKVKNSYAEKMAKEIIGESDTEHRHGRVNRLAQKFYDDVNDSGKFSWISLFEAEDELNRPRLVLYLKENPTPANNSHEILRRPNVFRSYSELALALGPNVLLDLYYYNNAGKDSQRVRRCIEDIGIRYGSSKHSPHATFLWETNLSK